VASQDEHLAAWTHSARAQIGTTEYIVDFGAQLKDCLIARADPSGRKRGGPPKHLIVFRDGVSDQQLKTVIDAEVEQIRELYKSVGRLEDLRLTVICIQKRHNCRATVAVPQGGDGQLPPGTILEEFKNVMLPEGCRGFWLCAHRGLIGTSHPALCVMTDKCDFQEDGHLSEEALQHFIYHLCSLCQRATKTVSYATPALYADHLAERADLLTWELRPQWREASKACQRKKGQPRKDLEVPLNQARAQAAREANEKLAEVVPSAGNFDGSGARPPTIGDPFRMASLGMNFFL